VQDIVADLWFQAWYLTGLAITALERLLGEAGGFWELDSEHSKLLAILKKIFFFLSSVGRTPNNLNAYKALCIHILDKTKPLLDLFTSLSAALCSYD